MDVIVEFDHERHRGVEFDRKDHDDIKCQDRTIAPPSLPANSDGNRRASSGFEADRQATWQD